MKASIIIPSIRPNTIKKCINRINETSKGIDYEIIVVAPKDLGVSDMENVKWVRDTKKGNIPATAAGFKFASGEYVMNIGDYFLFDTDCLKNLITLADSKEGIFLTGAKSHSVWGVDPECTIKDLIYPRLPFIKKETAEKLGGFIDDAYTYSHGDVDLAMRVYKTGGEVEVCPNAYTEKFDTEKEDIDDRLRPATDSLLFTERWEEFVANRKDFDCLKNYKDYPLELGSRMMMRFKQKNFMNIVDDFNNDYVASERTLPWAFAHLLLIWKNVPREIRNKLFERFLNLFNKKPYILYYRLGFNHLVRKESTYIGDSIKVALFLASLLINQVNYFNKTQNMIVEQFYSWDITNHAQYLQALTETTHPHLIGIVKKYMVIINAVGQFKYLKNIAEEI